MVVAQNLTLVGVTTVFLIMSGDLLQALVGKYEPVVFGNHCYCTMLVGAVLVPLAWLGTPKDFWLVQSVIIVSAGVYTIDI